MLVMCLCGFVCATCVYVGPLSAINWTQSTLTWKRWTLLASDATTKVLVKHDVVRMSCFQTCTEFKISVIKTSIHVGPLLMYMYLHLAHFELKISLYLSFKPHLFSNWLHLAATLLYKFILLWVWGLWPAFAKAANFIKSTGWGKKCKRLQ